VFSHPPRNPISRSIIALQNVGFRMTRKEFRTFAHPPKAMIDVCRACGFDATFSHRGAIWQVEGLVR
jgi:magnesium-protoporphyrin O-methyltransferase